MAKDIVFGAQFTESKLGKTGLTVTFNVYRQAISDLIVSQVATNGAATAIGQGLYSYKITGADLQTYYYWAVASTATTTVDQREVPAVQLDWLDRSVGVDLTIGERTTLYTGIWANGTRTLTAISDSVGVTTLLTRLTSTRAAYLDALTALTEGRMVWLERLGTALEETSVGSGLWRLTTLALSRLGVDVSAIKTKTDNLPASPATEASASAAATSAATAATQAAEANTRIQTALPNAAPGAPTGLPRTQDIPSSGLTGDQSALLSRIAAVVGVGLDPGPDTGWSEARTGNTITRRHPIPGGGTLVHTITVSSGSQSVAVTYE